MQQITDTIMMVRPASFGYNEETAKNNAFQSTTELSADELQAKAAAEFDAMVAKLRSKGVRIEVIQDTDEPKKPDAIFPNNWISFHEDGTVITYPMYAENRRIERREEVVEQLSESYKVDRRYTFDYYEEENKFLEGTGSMLFDRANNIVYACLSERTDAMVLEKYAVLMGSQKVAFRSVDRNGQDIYHTNVMMALGEDFVVVCLESIQNPAEREELVATLERTGKEIVDINYDQVEAYAGNMLQVKSEDGTRYLCMSQQAYDSLTTEQVATLEKYTQLLPIDIETIETIGGGSVRCMMAEVFLPKK